MSGPTLNLDTDDYLSATGHLSTTEHGAYLLLLMAMQRSADGWVQGSDVYLARATRMTLDRWNRASVTIRALLIAKGGKVSQKRIQRDRGGCENPGRDSGSDSGKGSNPLNLIGPKSKTAQTALPTPPPQTDSTLPLLEVVKDSESKGRKKTKNHKGRILQNDWQPADAERLYGRTVRHLSESQIDAAAEQMKRWALSNAHRAVARKTNWDLTFRNWLDRYAVEGVNGHANGRNGQRESRHGFAALIVNQMEREAGHVVTDDDEIFEGTVSPSTGPRTNGVLSRRGDH